MALLDIVQGAALRCNIPRPASAVGTFDPNVLKLVAFAQDAGDDLQLRWKWLGLKSALTFTGDGSSTLFTLPPNFGTFSPSDTFVSSLYPTVSLVGPINEENLLLLKSLPSTSTPAVWRRIANSVEIWPAPALGEIISSVYGNDYWITDYAGVPRSPSVWNADSDLSIIPEILLRYGTIWRFKRSNGLSYSEEFNTVESTFDLIAGQENQDRVITMSDSVPSADTWWPGSIVDQTTPNP